MNINQKSVILKVMGSGIGEVSLSSIASIQLDGARCV
jgi:hypothetical protein